MKPTRIGKSLPNHKNRREGKGMLSHTFFFFFYIKFISNFIVKDY